MDEETKEFLSEAGLAAYVPVFADNEIEFQYLSDLPEHQALFEKLIPKGGHQLKYMRALPKLLHFGGSDSTSSRSLLSSNKSSDSSMLILEDLRVPVDDTAAREIYQSEPIVIKNSYSLLEPETMHLPENDCSVIRRIAEKHLDGMLVLAVYKQKNQLDNISRLKLAKLIISHELALDLEKDISSVRFRFLAECVAKEFNEDPELWYNPTRTIEGVTCIPTGKLYDQYTGITKELRKYGLRVSRRGVKRKSQDPLTIDDLDDLGNIPQCLGFAEEINYKLDYLKSEVNDWKVIIKYWKDTLKLRQIELRAVNVCEYFSKYPALKQRGGYVLLEIDFKALFPEAYGRIHTHWNIFVEKVKEQLSIENIKVPAQCSDAHLLHLFTKLVTIVPVKVPKGNNAWKPSRKDVLDGFLSYSKTDDLEKFCNNIQERNRAKGLCDQPFPVVIGDSLDNITSNYLIMDGTPISLPSTKDAFAAAFYAYHALGCSYPVQSARLWVVIEKTLFGMDNVRDLQSQLVGRVPAVRRLAAALKV